MFYGYQHLRMLCFVGWYDEHVNGILTVVRWYDEHINSQFMPNITVAKKINKLVANYVKSH